VSAFYSLTNTLHVGLTFNQGLVYVCLLNFDVIIIITTGLSFGNNA